jgi:hypothetical protein
MAFWLSLMVACSACFALLIRSRSTFLRRIAFAAGAVAIGALLLLGSLWPSLHTLFALAALPALFVLAYGVVRPALAERRWVRRYGMFGVALSAASSVIQAAHMVTLW